MHYSIWTIHRKFHNFDVRYCISSIVVDASREMQLHVALSLSGTTLDMQTGWDPGWFHFLDNNGKQYQPLELGGCFTGTPAIPNGSTCRGWLKYGNVSAEATEFDFYIKMGNPATFTTITGIVLQSEDLVK
jgi:hypothetical protein